MGDILIGALMVGDCSERLCVRASRIWDFYDLQDETKLMHTDLVLLDEEGNSIHAHIYPPLPEKFKPLLKEGKVYNPSFIPIKKANRLYKPVQNDIMINFTRWTTVEEVIEVPPGFPEIVYFLTPIEKLAARVDSRESFTDVIGAVSVISDALPLRRRLQQVDTLKRTVTIRDASNATLDVVLWGERVASFPAEQLYNDGKNSPQVIIFVGTLVRSYAGNVSLSAGSSCKWYINPDVPKANSLMASMKNMHLPVTLAQQPVYSAPKPSTAEHQKISDIKHLNPFSNKKTEWLVTVKVMKIDSSWWYNSCKKCLRTARPHGDSYKCTNSDCNNIGAPTPRYKLVITGADETGEAEIVMFGRIAQRLIKRAADTLVFNNPPGFIPDEVTKLLERVFTFNVSFTENTISTGNISFQVNNIIAEIDDGSSVPLTPYGSQSSSVVLSQGASSNVKDTPDEDSGVPSQLSATPQSIGDSDKSKVTPTSSPLGPQQSATRKRARISLGKKNVKKLFVDDDGKNAGGDDDVDAPTEPSPNK